MGVDSDTYTLGARFSGNPKPFDFDAELDYQFGRFNGGDISAYSIALVGGYTLAGQLVELTRHVLKRAFRRIDSSSERIVLVDSVPIEGQGGSFSSSDDDSLRPAPVQLPHSGN